MNRHIFLILVLVLSGCGGRNRHSLHASSSSDSAATTAEVMVLPAVLPRVMIMVDEQSLGTIATSEVEAMAVRELTALKIPVTDQDMVRSVIARNQQMLEMVGDNRGAAALGAQFGADLILVGEAVAKPSARRIADTNLRSYQAVVTLRAIRSDNASTVAAVSEHSTQVCVEDVSGSAKVLRSSAKAALNNLIPAMLRNWSPPTAPESAFAHRLEISFGGVDQVWKLRAIRDMLNSRTEDLGNVTQRNYTMGMAEFSADARIPAEELAESFVLKPPDGLRLQVLGIATGQIQLRAVE